MDPLPFQHHPLEVACRLPVSKNVPAAFRVFQDFGGFFAGKCFWQQSVFFFFYDIAPMHFLDLFVLSLCGTSRPFPTTPWRAVSVFLARTLYARHPSIEWLFSMAFFATSTRCALSVEGTLQGLGQRGISVFCPAPEFGENDFLFLHGQDLCPEDWATPETKVCGHPLCCSFPSCVVVHSISCWFGDYPLHAACGKWTPQVM